MKNTKRWIAFLLVCVLLGAQMPGFIANAETNSHLTILGTTDMHSNIWGYSYEDNEETTNNGMARVSTYVNTVRDENPNTILIDNGDTIQGTILSDDLYNKKEGEHPVIAAMNYMQYDAMTLGNHEFNFGLGLIERMEDQAKFPILSANTTVKKTGDLFVGDYTIVEKDGVRVAVIGVTTPNVPTWDGEKVDALNFEDMSLAVKRTIEKIGDQADVFVVSAHAGMEPEFDDVNGSDGAKKILEENPKVSVLMVGHYHIVVNDKREHVVIGGARNSGRDVVRFDLQINGDKQVVSSDIQVVDMADYAPDAALRALPVIKKAHEKTIQFVYGGGSGEGNEGGGLLGSAAARFQPENEIKGIPEGKIRDTAVMDLINKVQLLNSGADVSAAALFTDKSDIPEGDINYGTIFGIYKFDNTLYRVQVTGKELKAYMEWSVECFNQYKEGDLSISFDPEYPGYLYDMFAGVDYEVNIAKPKGERIENVMFKGAPLKDDQTLTLAVNNYRYSSGLKAYNLVEAKKEWESPNSIRDMIVSYIKENSPISPEVDNNWKITGVDFSSPYRADLIQLVNNGQLPVPYNASLNVHALSDLLPLLHNVDVSGEKYTVSAYDIQGETYYRLRDLAWVLSHTDMKFSIDWDGRVLIYSGKEYTEAPLYLQMSAGEMEQKEMQVVVDGTTKTVSTYLIQNNNYVSAKDVAAILGIDAEIVNGVLSLHVK